MTKAFFYMTKTFFHMTETLFLLALSFEYIAAVK